jgi:putative phosphoribosyl transferase
MVLEVRMRLRDRMAAGEVLAPRLLHLKPRRPVVLALPRGGVPVAVPIAVALEAPVHVLLVRKIGAPWNAELGIGALVDGTPPQVLIDEAMLRRSGISTDHVAATTARELAELARRRPLYGHAPPDLAGRCVIVVDDGIATGGTMRVVAKALHMAAHRVLAVPVAPREMMAELTSTWDEVQVLQTPRNFVAVGACYDDFRQLSDQEVTAMLEN